MTKIPSYTVKAQAAYRKRVKAAGLVNYLRKIKPEWRETLDAVLAELRDKKHLKTRKEYD